jgi:hypothetical protein
MKRVLAAAALLLFATLTAAAQQLPFADYIAALERIGAHLAANQLVPARELATSLRGKQFASPAGPVYADDALLDAIIRAKTIEPQLRTRVAVTIEELRRAVPNAAGPADPELIEKLRKSEELPALQRGGDRASMPAGDLSLIETMAEAVVKAWNWIAEALEELFDWIASFFPTRSSTTLLPASTAGMGPMIIALVSVIVIVLIVLAVQAVRRGRAGEEVVVSEPLGSKRDEDPLSRGANEWERYAVQLASEKRWREAIRAWYHAVLVTLYASGILHFRKGRTNWEYVASLGPSLAWRADFVQLTRRFEHEWYGRRESSQDAYDECGDDARNILAQLDERIRRGAA